MTQLEIQREIASLHRRVSRLKAYDEFACHVYDTSESEENSKEFLADIISYTQITIEDYGTELSTRSINALKRWMQEAETFLKETN